MSNAIVNNRIAITRRTAVALAAVAGLGAVCLPPTRAYAFSSPDDVKAVAHEISDTYGDLFASLKSRDFVKAKELAHTGSDQVTQLQSMLDDPLWVIAQWIPVYGEDVSAAHKLTETLGKLTGSAIVPLCDFLAETPLNALFRVNDFGNMDIDMTALKALVAIAEDAIPAFKESRESLASIGDLHIEELDAVVAKAKGYIDPLDEKLFKYEKLIPLLPQIFDDEGRERLYLVVAQNNVEMRSLGGFPGAWCPVRVNRGTVIFGDVTNVYQVIPVNRDRWLEITDDEYDLFGESIAYMPGNDTIIPDFPRVCDLWSQFWEIYQGRAVDGVIAVDPILFQDIIGLTEGIEMYDGTVVDGTNAARVLMHDTYWNHMDSAKDMDAYFSEVAGSAVHAIVNEFNSIDLKKFRKVLSRGIDNGNLIMWLADPTEQDALRSFGATGELSYDEAKPILGIYLSNESYSKIDWWLDRDIVVGGAVQNDDGSTTTPVTLELFNTATWEEIDAANAYIAGENPAKYDKDDAMYWIFLYAPAGGSIDDVEVTGQCELTTKQHNGLQVWTGRAHVQIDKPVTVKFKATTSPSAESPLAIRKTPTVQDVR